MDIVVVGSGGLAREFSSFFSEMVNIVGYSTINPSDVNDYSLKGKLFGDEITPKHAGTKYAVIAVGLPSAKKRLAKQLKNSGFEFPNFIHPSVVSATNLNNIDGEGVIISPNSVIGSNVSFANQNYINIMVGIGHDTKFDNYVQVNPGVQIGGSVDIGEGVLIGSGSTIRHGLNVNKHAIVGSGSVVFSPVRSGITVIGNPARRLRIPKF